MKFFQNKTNKQNKQNKQNKTVKNKMDYKNTNKFSWENLEKTNCSFVNESKEIKTPLKKLKKITFEEAIIWPTQTEDVNEISPLEYLINTGVGENKYNKLLDITGLRLKQMKENNIIIQVISPTAFGLQNLKATKISEQVSKAIDVNNYMYNKIKSYSNHFKAFCTLPMRDPKSAAKELERCVKKLGMLGALVNGNDILYDSKGKNNKMLFYDSPEYDVLWKKFVELDVPIYIHPTVYSSNNGMTPDSSFMELFKEYPQLPGSAWGFSIYLAQHILRLILSGVFDRFPKLKLILGHMGEVLPWWAERFDHRICIYKQELKQISKKKLKEHNLPIFKIPKLSVQEYLKKNIYVTTSGWFSDSALKYVIEKMGIDRVLFSIDYPYEDQKSGSDWIERVPLSKEDKEKIAYKNAEKLLKI